MSHQDIAGIAANIFKESSFRHNSKDSSGYHGYVQMSPDMQQAVINTYGNLNPDTQLQFVYDQITGNSKVKGYTNGAGYQYGKYKTGGDAAEAFRSTFERNKAGRQQSRIDYGNQFYDYFNQRSLKQKVGQQPKPIVLQPVSTAVRQPVPAEQTRHTWTGAENESPYVTGKPVIKLQPRIQLPSLVEMMEDSEWMPPFPQLKPMYKDGKVPNDPYERFKYSLPDNQKNTPESEYNTRRYWELNGRPKSFQEAVEREMYDLQEDGWHANSVSYNQNTGEYEFMKPRNHPTVHKELEWYNSDDAKEFRKKYKHVQPKNSNFDKYVPRFKDGKSPIYIKPANRGKFTALKKRTGHSASWFKENGTPAQKKMAVFALNAKKWKH